MRVPSDFLIHIFSFAIADKILNSLPDSKISLCALKTPRISPVIKSASVNPADSSDFNELSKPKHGLFLFSNFSHTSSANPSAISFKILSSFFVEDRIGL